MFFCSVACLFLSVYGWLGSESTGDHVCWTNLLCPCLNVWIHSFDELEFLTLIDAHWSLFSFMVNTFWLWFDALLCLLSIFQRWLLSQLYFQDPFNEKCVMTRNISKSCEQFIHSSMYGHLKSRVRTYWGIPSSHMDTCWVLPTWSVGCSTCWRIQAWQPRHRS